MRKHPVFLWSLVVVVLFCSLKVPPASCRPLLLADDEASLKSGKVGIPYEFQFQTEGGLAPLKWKVVDGQLPPGLELLPSGILRGTPATARQEPYVFEVEVSDSSKPAQAFSQRCVLSINGAPLRIVTNTPPLKIVQPNQNKVISPLAPPLESRETTSPSVKVASERFESENSSSGTARNLETTSTVSNGKTPNSAKPRAATLPVAGEVKAVNISTPLREGRTIKGKVELADPTKDPSALTTKVTVDTVDLLANKIDAVEWVKNGDEWTGDFTITLKTPIASNSNIKLTIAGVESVSTPAVPAIDYDWGRVRAYFSGGVVFSKERGEFKDQDLAFGFNLDKNWYQGKGKFFNTFFETRLTTVPVEAEMEETTTNEDTDEMEVSEIDTFLASKKAALMQVGGYLPLYRKSWTWKHEGFDNALFIAPLFKLGILTISDGKETAEGKIFGGDDVFNFKAGGVRLGHYKLLNDRDQAPELISYLDITVGKWENFEIALPKRDANNQIIKDAQGNVVHGDPVKDWRYGFEGRLKIPFTPLQIGFDANLGNGRDDVRFIFGTRFDIGTLFAKIKLLQELGVK